MKAVVFPKYGPPDVLEIKEVEKPTPKENEVLIRVIATTITPVDCTFRKGDVFLARLFTGINQPKNPILGSEFSGVVDDVGENVKKFKKGDEVFGGAEGTYAEYICVNEDAVIAHKPTQLTLEEAAAVPYGVLTALPFLTDAGSIQSGHRVLVNGASGSIGSYAVQLAKYYGAEVTGVCSSANVEMVESLGADKVIDYREENFTKTGERWDIIFDSVGKSSFSESKNAMSSNGIYLTTVMSAEIQFDMLRTAFSSQKAKISLTGLRKPEEMRKDLLFAKELIEEEKIRVMIDRVYPFEEIPKAHKYVERGHKKGNVIIKVSE